MINIVGSYSRCLCASDNEGNIVVDGVVASCYGSYNHDLAHIAMTPMRWFPAVLELILGGKEFVDIAQDFWGMVATVSVHLWKKSIILINSLFGS